MQHALMLETLFNASSCTGVEGKPWNGLPCKFMRCKAPWRDTL